MRRWAAFAALAGLAILALLPLRLALGGTGIAARAVTGTLWAGRLTAAEWHGLPLGDLSLRLAPAALATATARYRIDGPSLSGALWRTTGGGGITAMNGTLATAGLAPLPITSLQLQGVDADIRSGACRQAGGEVRATLTGIANGAVLSGRPRCDNAALLLPLASADGQVRLDLKLLGTAWTARLTLGNLPETERALLLASGFRPGPGGLVLDREGHL